MINNQKEMVIAQIPWTPRVMQVGQPHFTHKPYLVSYQHDQNEHPVLDQKSSKTMPLLAAHTYIANIREFPLPGDVNVDLFLNYFSFIRTARTYATLPVRSKTKPHNVCTVSLSIITVT